MTTRRSRDRRRSPNSLGLIPDARSRSLSIGSGRHLTVLVAFPSRSLVTIALPPQDLHDHNTVSGARAARPALRRELSPFAVTAGYAVRTVRQVGRRPRRGRSAGPSTPAAASRRVGPRNAR